jgi:hypothetical protein
MWFPARGDRETSEAARKVCMACMVRDQCRAANLDQRDGVYGALTANARRELRGVDDTPVTIASRCGSNAGYHAHRRAGEPACDACRLAHAHYTQDRDREKATA